MNLIVNYLSILLRKVEFIILFIFKYTFKLKKYLN